MRFFHAQMRLATCRNANFLNLRSAISTSPVASEQSVMFLFTFFGKQMTWAERVIWPVNGLNSLDCWMCCFVCLFEPWQFSTPRCPRFWFENSCTQMSGANPNTQPLSWCKSLEKKTYATIPTTLILMQSGIQSPRWSRSWKIDKLRQIKAFNIWFMWMPRVKKETKGGVSQVATRISTPLTRFSKTTGFSTLKHTY